MHIHVHVTQSKTFIFIQTFRLALSKYVLFAVRLFMNLFFSQCFRRQSVEVVINHEKNCEILSAFKPPHSKL